MGSLAEEGVCFVLCWDFETKLEWLFFPWVIGVEFFLQFVLEACASSISLR